MTSADHHERPFEDSPLSAEEMYALVATEKLSVHGQMAAFVPMILAAWGIAWLFGFGILWLAALPDAAISAEWAGAIFAFLLFGAGITSAILGIRSERGVKPNKANAFTGIVYGNTWWVGSVAIWLAGLILVNNGMEQKLLGLFYPVLFIVFAGIMYIFAAVLWHAIPMLVLGIWSILTAVVGPLFGMPTHYLVFALAGGGGFLIISGWSWWWARQARRRAAGKSRRG